MPKSRLGMMRPRRLWTRIGAFGTDRRGNTAIIFALAALPLISAVGCVVDYSMASAIKTKLQAAADAATLASVSNNSPIVTTAKSMTGNGTVSGSATYFAEFLQHGNQRVSGRHLQRQRHQERTDTHRERDVFLPGADLLSWKSSATSKHHRVRLVDGELHAADLHQFLSDARRLRIHELSFDGRRAGEADGGQSRQFAGNGYPQGCQFACHFTAQGACAQTGDPRSGTDPAVGPQLQWLHTKPSPGGYCQGFTISRLGTTPASFASGTTNTTNGSNVNWTNTPVSTCSTAGTTSCIQLRADAVGYAVNALLSQAATTETNDGISNQFRGGTVSVHPKSLHRQRRQQQFLLRRPDHQSHRQHDHHLRPQLANLLDTGANATLGSGGTHFENALNSMNSFITSVGTGSGSSNPLPYVFIVTDGSQDYQTQSGGNWSSQNWTANATVPYQNSATVMPPNTRNHHRLLHDA